MHIQWTALPGEIEFETFNGAAARLTVQGLSVHPGDAKGKMINAMKVIAEANAMLPQRSTRRRHRTGKAFIIWTESRRK